jgi:hypothetical protein
VRRRRVAAAVVAVVETVKMRPPLRLARRVAV